MGNEKTAMVFPSVNDVKPLEEGGPIARAGFTYQDHIAVGFLIEMLGNPSLQKVHCETHDDILLVWEESGLDTQLAEFVQVKANKLDKLWSIANLCARKKKDSAGTSIYEISLSHDRHCEKSCFRIVTLRPVVSDLKMLTFHLGAPGREVDGEMFNALNKEIDKRCPGVKSPKGNGSTYWLKNCFWDERHSEDAVRKENFIRLFKLSVTEGFPLLPEHAQIVLDDLLVKAKAAGDARWEPDRDKKIFTREVLLDWWLKRLHEITEGSSASSGGKLREKMVSANIPDLIELAVELRRDYAATMRTSRYMEPEEIKRLQGQVKSEVASLRARNVAGQINLNSKEFHSLCLERMDALNAAQSKLSDDRSAFLKGCMYDIVDRCLHRFDRPS